MANQKISELTSAGALTGTEVLPIVQSGTTVKTTAQDIADLASSTPLYSTTTINISSAQLLNLFNNPVSILPTLASNQFYDIETIIFDYRFGTVAYSGMNTIFFKWTDDTTLFAGAVQSTGSITKLQAYQHYLKAGKGIYLINSGANPVNGDGTVVVYVVYRILSV